MPPKAIVTPCLWDYPDGKRLELRCQHPAHSPIYLYPCAGDLRSLLMGLDMADKLGPRAKAELERIRL